MDFVLFIDGILRLSTVLISSRVIIFGLLVYLANDFNNTRRKTQNIKQYFLEAEAQLAQNNTSIKTLSSQLALSQIEIDVLQLENSTLKTVIQI